MRNVIRKKGESSKKRELKQNGRIVRLVDLKDQNLEVIGRNQVIDIYSRRPMIALGGGELYVDLTISSEDFNANDCDMGIRDSGKDIQSQSGSTVGQGDPNLRPPSRVPSDMCDKKKGKPKNKRQGSRLRRNSNVEKNVGKHTVLCWMIDMGTIQPNDRVYYMEESKSVLLDGIITRGGICCKCCHAIVTISEFEAHSGSKHSDPLRNICLEGGASLLHCMLEAWNKKEGSKLQVSNLISVSDEDLNDNTCIVCGDYGNLLCCDSCPSTFHQSCLEMDISEKLERLIGVKHDIKEGFSWTLIRRTNVDFEDMDMKSHMVEWNSKLSLALSLMNDCFQPCIDGRTNINVLNSILYNCWSNFNRLNFEKFVTAILEKDDKIICTASIR
ncbi:hypothetical protein TanjilG_31044 [Lupinus angustifolius]|uniref:Zinc finger PHD-type domain-containing protein n=1 Tax=Lupinus angustifolius TaxID=3871 RepID=A0A394DD28_LUPAN|nr:hypothetical protein TanjilG_31044 [Lupinus angustifolius]